ncbi:hypothetical protein ABH942_001826 [Flavobacterium sp. 28YEA47A]|uniref:hypothetical protein n=1 Tax=Flavobacterium sp. 28YEA47A TaxID=3156276 RepID=UPI003519A51B
MRKKLKNIGLILVFLSSLAYVSCHKDEIFSDEEQLAARETGSKNIICNGKRVLRFNSLAELQQAHLQLYQQYENGNQEEQVLVDYETANNFYSLRKKAEDMDDGIIPDDPTFDETKFTLDPILETLLNQDGMIIIGDRLYIWDSGCLIQSIPFSCSNYENLLAFFNASKTNSTSVMHSIFINNNMQNVNTCDDANYDLETISENRGKVGPGKVEVKSKNGCGYEVVINSNFVKCTEEWNFYKISYQSIKPLDAGLPLNIFYLSSAFGDLDGLEFSPTGDDGSFYPISLTFQDQNYGYVVPFSTHFFIRIPVAETNIFNVSLLSSIELLQGNSCSSFDAVDIDNSCPFTIIAIKDNASSSQATWIFSIPQTEDCPIGEGKVLWNFGDGTSETAGPSITHTYTMPCKMTYLTVTATVNGMMCGVTGKVLTKGNIPYGNPCMRENYKFPTYKGHANGKKYKLVSQLKRTFIGKSKVINKYKHGIMGYKTIKSIGAIYNPAANNSGCLELNITSILGPKITNGKKRNRQKALSVMNLHINAENPYKINFSHSNGFTHALTADDLYCSQ